MAYIVALPFDKVLILISELATVQNGFNFIFKFFINLNRCRRRWLLSVDHIPFPRRQTVDMKHRVLVHIWGKAESVG